MDCEIIRDLLPLYHDGACSQASRAAVEEHLKTCPACQAELRDMDAPLPETAPLVPDEASTVRAISRAWKKDRRRAWWKGALIAAAVCAVLAAVGWFLTDWTVIPMTGEEYAVQVYRLESGAVGVEWTYEEGEKLWTCLTWEVQDDGLHYYLKRPILRMELLNLDNKSYRSEGAALFSDFSDTSQGQKAVYFGLGEDAVLLWQEGETVPLDQATEAQEAAWAPAQQPPRELSQVP